MRHHSLTPVLASLAGCLALLCAALPATAADHAGKAAVVVGDGKACAQNDHRCRVRVIKDDGESDTVEIDLSGIGEAIGAAMQGVSRALAELDTVQVVSERGGRRLIIREDDHEAVVDVDAIMGEVNKALALAFAEVHDHARPDREAAVREHREAREQLRREVRELKDDQREDLRAEIDSLRRELKSLQAQLRAEREGR